MRNDLQYDLCPGCGEIHPAQLGLIPLINHSCPANTYTYRMYGGAAVMRMLNDLFMSMDGKRTSVMQPFYDLLKFDTFKAMPNFETASYMDKFIYSVTRDMDVAAMKRLRAYVELEEDFNAKY
jgi:hypothetical protein